MVVVHEKFFIPPPAYTHPHKSNYTFAALPAHILLQIVSATFSDTNAHIQTLHWLHTNLRLVNKALYIACMHILRSTYLKAYDTLVRPPYSSDPFPSSSSLTTHNHRELTTLDLFIAVLVHEDMMQDATSLHLPRHEAYRDIFDLLQPRSRLEDLLARHSDVVCMGDWEMYEESVSVTVESKESPYAISPLPSSISLLTTASTLTLYSGISKRSGLFSFRLKKAKSKSSVAPISIPSSSYNYNIPHRIKPLPFSALSISFSPRKVGLVYTPPSPSTSTLTVTGQVTSSSSSPQRKRTIVEVPRTWEDSLEYTAGLLVQALREWLVEDMNC